MSGRSEVFTPRDFINETVSRHRHGNDMFRFVKSYMLDEVSDSCLLALFLVRKQPIDNKSCWTFCSFLGSDDGVDEQNSNSRRQAIDCAAGIFSDIISHGISKHDSKRSKGIPNRLLSAPTTTWLAEHKQRHVDKKKIIESDAYYIGNGRFGIKQRLSCILYYNAVLRSKLGTLLDPDLTEPAVLLTLRQEDHSGRGRRAVSLRAKSCITSGFASSITLAFLDPPLRAGEELQWNFFCWKEETVRFNGISHRPISLSSETVDAKLGVALAEFLADARKSLGDSVLYSQRRAVEKSVDIMHEVDPSYRLSLVTTDNTMQKMIVDEDEKGEAAEVEDDTAQIVLNTASKLPKFRAAKEKLDFSNDYAEEEAAAVAEKKEQRVSAAWKSVTGYGVYREREARDLKATLLEPDEHGDATKEVSSQDLTRILKEQWKNMPQADKEPYETEAENRRKQHALLSEPKAARERDDEYLEIDERQKIKKTKT
jgi:hypothetical protein